MTDQKKTYEKLDEIGLLGLQEKKSPASQKYHRLKTGEVFRRARAAKKKKAEA